jgi:hypothetical protein
VSLSLRGTTNQVLQEHRIGFDQLGIT